MRKAERTGLGDFSISSRLVGAGFYIAWIEVIYSSDTFIPSAALGSDSAIVIYPVSTLGLVVGLVLMALLPLKANRMLSSRAAIYTVSCLAGVCTLFACTPGYLPLELYYTCVSLTGVLTAVLAVKAGTLISELDSRTAIITLAVVQLIALLLFAFTVGTAQYFGNRAALAIACCLLPVAGYLLELDDGSPKLVVEDYALKMPPGFWRVVASLTIFEFACCMVRGFFPGFLDDAQYSGARWLTACLALVVMSAIVIAAARARRDAPFGSICYNAMIALTFVVALVPLLGFGSMASGVLATVLFMVSLLIAWAILLRITYRTGASVITVFGLGFAGAAFGSDAGFVLGTTLIQVDLPSNLSTGLCVVVVVTCILATIFVLRRGDLENLMEPPADDLLAGEDALILEDGAIRHLSTDEARGGEAEAAKGPGQWLDSSRDDAADVFPNDRLQANGGEDGEAAPDFRRTLRYRCSCITEEYGLSARETEVLFLVAKGNDAKAIAEELVVSYNTARTHIRNIYTKMDVHSRHDLFEIVNDPKYRL